MYVMLKSDWKLLYIFEWQNIVYVKEIIAYLEIHINAVYQIIEDVVFIKYII